MSMLFEGISRETLFRRMEKLTGITLEGRVELESGTGLSVSWSGSGGVISGESAPAVCRALFLLSCHIREQGENLPFRIREEKHFEDCGVMVDVSRGGVLKTEAVFRLLDRTAALGMNVFMLYTEDLYTLEDYPYFGYLRGRYSDEELKHVDDYAAEMGVEVIPCIQTLAHMGSFLQWNTSITLRDQATVLMCDDEDAYRLIETEIWTMRSLFRSRRIHIGMDEAASVGLGRYFQKHGPVDRFELLTRHMKRVTDLCRKYGYEPMLWSDMFFRLASAGADYYDPEARIPESALSDLPQAVLCYWDYEHEDEAHYDRMLKTHEGMNRPFWFAGGVHTWHGFLPDFRMADATMVPALRACLRHHVPSVLATIWGDDGNETDCFLALSRLALFSEACWKGRLEETEWKKMGERISGYPESVCQAMAAFFPGTGDIRIGKGLIWGDLLYPFVTYPGLDMDAYIQGLHRAVETLGDMPKNTEANYMLCALTLAARKAEIMQRIRSAYTAKDRAGLEKAKDEIGEAVQMQKQLMRAHRTLWWRDMKPQGWELLCRRYGATAARMKDVKEELEAYLEGTLEAVAVLEEPALPSARKGGMQFYQTFSVPSHYL